MIATRKEQRSRDENGSYSILTSTASIMDTTAGEAEHESNSLDSMRRQYPTVPLLDARDDLEAHSNDRPLPCVAVDKDMGENLSCAEDDPLYKKRAQQQDDDDITAVKTNIISSTNQQSQAQSQTDDSVIDSFWDALLSGCGKSGKSLTDNYSKLIRPLSCSVQRTLCGMRSCDPNYENEEKCLIPGNVCESS
jgi:hypothetical protein